jgi:hypothetical protein
MTPETAMLRRRSTSRSRPPTGHSSLCGGLLVGCRVKRRPHPVDFLPSLRIRQRTHPAHISHEGAGSSRQSPAIPARSLTNTLLTARIAASPRPSSEAARPACHAGGRGFESRRSRLSKLLEAPLFRPRRAGASIPRRVLWNGSWNGGSDGSGRFPRCPSRCSGYDLKLRPASRCSEHVPVGKGDD